MALKASVIFGKSFFRGNIITYYESRSGVFLIVFLLVITHYLTPTEWKVTFISVLNFFTYEQNKLQANFMVE